MFNASRGQRKIGYVVVSSEAPCTDRTSSSAQWGLGGGRRLACWPSLVWSFALTIVAARWQTPWLIMLRHNNVQKEDMFNLHVCFLLTFPEASRTFYFTALTITAPNAYAETNYCQRIRWILWSERCGLKMSGLSKWMQSSMTVSEGLQ